MKSVWYNPGLRKNAPTEHDFRKEMLTRGWSLERVERALDRMSTYKETVTAFTAGGEITVDASNITVAAVRKLIASGVPAEKKAKRAKRYPHCGEAL